MMTSTPDRDDLLQRRIRDALLHEWDPIGIQEFPEAQDEYDSYVPDVCHLVLSGASFEDIFAYLWSLETQHMGLRGDRQRTEHFANRVIEIGEEVQKGSG
jgi:hypothetical protein